LGILVCMDTTNSARLALRDSSRDCRGGSPNLAHPWVCLRPAVDRPDGVGLVRVTCSRCGHAFQQTYTGTLSRGFFAPSHAPRAVRFHGPAHVPSLAGRSAS
jgi:hypothetical protein